MQGISFMAPSGTTKKSGRMSEEEYIEAVLTFLYQAETPSCHIKQIAEGIGINQNTLPRYLELATHKYGYTALQEAGPVKLYYLTEKGQKKARALLSEKE